MLYHKILLRPGADQSSKAAFSKHAFAKTCFLLLKIRPAHINRAKSKNAFEHILTLLAESILLVARAKTCSKVLLLFARLVSASHIFNKRKHVRACFSKSAFAKSSFARLVCAQPKRKCYFGICTQICSKLILSVGRKRISI